MVGGSGVNEFGLEMSGIIGLAFEVVLRKRKVLFVHCKGVIYLKCDLCRVFYPLPLANNKWVGTFLWLSFAFG